MDLIIGNEYKWKHEDVILIYLGKGGNWHRFDKADTRKIWCEVLDCDLYLMEEAK